MTGFTSLYRRVWDIRDWRSGLDGVLYRCLRGFLE